MAQTRRALTHVGGDVETGGDRAAAARLVRALDVAGADERAGVGLDAAARDRLEGTTHDDPGRAHVHGFHAYPARMHPQTAARLLGDLVPPKGTVLDPFAGSGTVLVEARLLGRSAIGTDLNPLAVALAKLKSTPPPRSDMDALLAAAQTVREHADGRRKARAGATRRYGPDDTALFAPHGLLELDGVRDGVLSVEAPRVREALLLVLSAILIKVSQRTSDTSEHASPRRIAAGYTAKLFLKKTEELVERLDAYARMLPRGAPAPRVALDDATRLASVGEASVDAIVTSPPYAATYDYLSHHAARLRWLGLDTRPLARGELGARRHYRTLSARDAERAWVSELTSFLKAAARVARRRAPLVMLIADSAVGDHALRADDLVLRAADAASFVPVARATQRRPHFHGPTADAFARKPRGEHALLLERA